MPDVVNYELTPSQKVELAKIPTEACRPRQSDDIR